MYPYERFIGALFDLIHGRQQMATELAAKYSRRLQSRALQETAFAEISSLRGNQEPTWNRFLKTREQLLSRYLKSNHEKQSSLLTLTEGQRESPHGHKVSAKHVPPLAAFFDEYPQYESLKRHQIWQIGGHAVSLRGRRLGTCDQQSNSSCVRIRLNSANDSYTYVQAHKWYHVRLFDAQLQREAVADLVFLHYHELTEGPMEDCYKWPRILDWDKKCALKGTVDDWCEASIIDKIAVLGADFKSGNGHFIFDFI
jgi:hypothetical protein